MDDLTAWLRQQLDADTAEIAKHPDGGDAWVPVDDLTGWLGRQIENQRHRANALKALAVALPAETADWLTGIADLLHADADAKREIIAKYEGAMAQEPKRPDDLVNRGYILGMNAAAVALIRAYAGQPGFRPEWMP